MLLYNLKKMNAMSLRNILLFIFFGLYAGAAWGQCTLATGFASPTLTVTDTATALTGGPNSFFSGALTGAIPSSSASVTICKQGRFNFTLAGFGNATGYSWSTTGGTILSGGSTASVVLELLPSNTSAGFTMNTTVTCPGGTATVTITVNSSAESPVASFVTPPATACAGTAITLTASNCTGGVAAGQNCFPTLTHYFLSPTGLLQGTAASTYNTGVLTAGTRRYSLVVKNGNKCYAKIASDHTLTVNANPSISAITASNRCANQIASTGAVTCTGCTAPSYNWEITGPSTDNFSPGATPTWTTNLSSGAYTARLTVTDNGCTSVTTAPFTVNANPAVTATANGVSANIVAGDNLCISPAPGPTVALNVTSSTALSSAVWSGSTTIVNPNVVAASDVCVIKNVNNFTYNYSVSVIDVNGCTATDGISVVVWDTLPVNVTLKQGANTITSICQGESVTVELSSTHATLVFPTDGDHAGGASAANARFKWTRISASGPNPPAYPTSNDNSIALGPFTTAGTFVYRAEVNSPTNSCNSFAYFTITVNPVPVASITTAAGLLSCSNTPITLNGSISSGSFSAWLQDGVLMTGAGTTTQTLSTSFANTGNSNVNVTYSLIAVSGSCYDTAVYVVTYKPQITVDIEDPLGPQCSGANFPIDPTETGAASYTYLWQNGSTSPTFTITSPTAGQTTNVAVTITSNGCSATDAATFSFIDCGSWVLWTNTGGTNRVCEGDTLRMTIRNNLYVSSAPGTYDMFNYWSNGSYGDSINIPITSSTPNTFTIFVSSDLYQLYCEYYDLFYCGGCCYNDYYWLDYDYQSITISVVRPNVLITPTDSIEYCFGDTISMAGSCPSCGGGAAFSWSIGGPTNLTARTVVLTTDTTIYVRAVESGCVDTAFVNYSVKPEIAPDILQGDTLRFCRGDFFTLDGSSVVCNSCTSEWSSGQTGNLLTSNQPGQYWYEVTNLGCSEYDTINVLYYPQQTPVIEDTSGVTISGTYIPLCNEPRPIRVRASSCPGCNFTWNTGATTPGISVVTNGGYFVESIDINGCESVSAPLIAQQSLVGLGTVASANPSMACNGDPFSLTVPPCFSCSYLWYDDYNDSLLATNTRIYTTTDTGTYYAVIVNADGCTYPTNLVTVLPLSIVTPVITASTDSLCAGETSIIRVNSNPAHVAFQWYKDSVVISGAIDSVYGATTTGDYYVLVTYSNGCRAASPEIRITNAVFAPTASATNSVVCQGSTVNVSTQTNPGWTYQWYRNGNVIPGAVASTYPAILDGQYYAVVTSDFGCTEQTNAVTLGVTTLGNVNAVTNKTEICPGETANLSVTLCAGCSYQWFNAISGGPLTGVATSNFNYNTTVTGSYYARASNGTCFVNSDTLQITALSVVIPAINTSSSFICNGQTAALITSGCSGCIYTWMRDSLPVFGALNDTFFIVSNAADTGLYQVRVNYTNGCAATSAGLDIASGAYNLRISIDSTAGGTVVCNNSPVILEIDTVNSSPLNYCALGCNFQWVENSVPIIPSNTARYNTAIGNTHGGFYKLVMIDSRGCTEESNLLLVNEVNLNPVITAPSNAICGNAAVMLTYTDAASCVGCTYQWQKGGGPATFGPINLPTYTTDTGSAGVGVYSLLVTQLGCTASSNLFPLNQISGLSIPIASTDPNICNGDTTTIYRVGGGCVNCQFQWLNENGPILAATTPSLTVSGLDTFYLSLEMTIGTSGCKDTSMIDTLYPVPSPISSFDLAAANLTPLTSTGPIVNLHNAVFPTTVSLADTFYSQPFNAALGPNSGLSGVDDEFMNPSIAGAGYHRIYYRYDTLGCKFIYDDILYVFGDPNVNIVNENISAPQYEACVADTIQLQVFNMPFNITNVYLFDVNNVYTSVPIASSTLNDTIFGIDTVWNGTIRVGIPDWAQASFMMVTSAANADTFITPFILIHNSNLDISGLPNVVCSNGTAIPLSGVPTGGFFTAQYNSGSTLPLGTNVAGAFSGLNFNTGAMTRASYGTDQIQNVRVVYNFNNRYTNGITCPQTDTVSKIIEARAVFLDSVKYNPISVSQDRELLENLVFRVYPYAAQPSQWTSAAVGGSISFAGNYTFPAGNPLDFLPKNAGVGKHAMTYRIHNGVCMNSKTDSINVIAAPNPIGIPDSMCRTQTFANFGRQLGLYSYFDGPNIPILPGVFFSDTTNIIRVSTTAGPNAGLTVIGSAINLEQYNYNPAAVPGNFDTLRVEYWYKKIERVGGVPVDTIMYIVGSIVTPIFIETPFPVDIIDSIVANVYCEVDQLYLLAGSPSGGVFSLQGGSGAYAAGATVVNNILNPYTIHSPESTTTNYTLTYVKTGAVCQNSDSKVITIPEPLDPTFGTASGKRVFCQTDPTENIVINTVGTFTPVWLINGITQPQPPRFNPNVLNPGNQVVTHLVTDTVFGCTYTAVDTYRINPLPVLAVTPLLDTAYCTNDPNDTVRVSPNPICAQFVSGGLTMLFESFDAVAFPWNRQNTGAGNTWVRTTVLPYAGTGAAFVNSSNSVEDAWMFTPTLALTTGHSYQVTVFAAAGNCAPPPCLPAQFKVRVGQGQTIATQTAGTTFGDTSINHTFYQPYIFTYTHTGLSGNYNFSFQCLTGIDGRSLTLDDISIVDASVSGCVLGGVGTMVGPGINYVSDSTYAFNPRIVAPGNYNIRYVYTAAATGCTDSIQMPVRVKPHPITSFTGLNPQYCDNAPIVPLVGTPSGGLFSSTGPNLVSSPFWAFDPNTGFANEIISYTYTDLATNCTTTIRDTTTVLSITDSARISTILPAGYCVNVDSVVLNVSTVFGAPAAGSFYGLGVRNGTLGPLAARFYPDTAVIDGGRYGDFTITYIYPTSNGCIDTTRAIARVHAMPDLSFVSLPDSVCLNAGIIQVRVNNHVITGALGQIQYDTLIPVGPTFVGGGTYVPSLGLQDTLNPMNFGTGWHNMQYTYTDINGCMSSIRDSFRVDTIPVIRFSGLQADRIYCENDIPSLLLAYPPYYPGSGYLQLTSGLDSIVVDSSFYLINPAIFADTLNPNRRWDVYYTFEDLNFCSNSGVDSFFVRPYPRITMAMPPTFCSAPTLEPLMPFVTPQGGIFTDNLVVTGIAQDTMLNLSGTMGPRRITYYYLDTVSTCRNNAYQDVTLYNTPDVDFYALGGCVGANIIFVSDSAVNNLTPGLDSITRVEWIFGDGNNAVVFPPLATEIPNQTYVYATNGVYQVQMAVTNQGQCTDTVTRQLVVSPYVNTYPYVQDFQAGAGNWYQEQPIIVPDTAAVWQRAQLLGNTINDPGNFAWVTRPNAPYTYNQDDRGWVYSPCFDFSTAWRPMIVMDIWRDFLTDVDGAVLEYYDEWAYTWIPVGETDKGINWYQTDFLVSRPGNQPTVTYPRGWTGESSGWEKARYRLDALAGRPNVRFRVAFASDPNTVLEGHEGMAFDSVWIGERGRNVLVEHYSNYYHVNQQGAIMDVIDQFVYDTIYNNNNGRDVSLIQYQTDIVNLDPINAQYSTDFDARVLYYGINANSQIRVDGMTHGTGKSEDLRQWDLEYDMLQFPVFNIQIDPLVFSGNTIQISTTTTALANVDSSDYSITVAITEDFVYNGRGFPMKSVLRKLLPDATGYTYQQAWTPGQSVSQNPSWVYSFGTLNPNNIQATVYIQNNATKDVLQVATTRDLSIFPPVGTIPTEEEASAREDLAGMNLFPNPASSYFNVTFETPLSDDYTWNVVDVLGRVVQTGQVEEGSTQIIVESYRLSEGTYFFTMQNEKGYAQRKVVITQRP